MCINRCSAIHLIVQRLSTSLSRLLRANSPTPKTLVVSNRSCLTTLNTEQPVVKTSRRSKVMWASASQRPMLLREDSLESNSSACGFRFTEDHAMHSPQLHIPYAGFCLLRVDVRVGVCVGRCACACSRVCVGVWMWGYVVVQLCGCVGVCV